MKYSRILKFLATFGLLLHSSNAFSFMQVGFIHYRNLSGDSFEVTLIMFKDNPSPAFPNVFMMPVDDPVTIGPPDLFATMIKNDSVSLPNGLTSFRYQDTVLLTHPGKWLFIVKGCCLPPVDNISVANNSYAFVSMLDYSGLGGKNTSRFDIPPMTFAQYNEPLYFNPGFYDHDHDSLRFSLVAPKDTTGIYGTPISGANWTLPTGMTIVDSTGEINWTPLDSGNFEVRLLLQEFDSLGYEKASVDYNLYFIVRPFPGNLRTVYTNTAGWPTNVSGRFEFAIAAVDTFTLVAIAQDPDGSLVNAMAAGGESNTVTTSLSIFAPVQSNDSTMIGNFSWAPAVADVRTEPYVVVLRAQEVLTGQTAFTDLTFNLLVMDSSFVGTDHEKIASFNIWPNPASDWVSIEYQLWKRMDISLQIMDLSGRIVSKTAPQIFPEGKVVFMENLSNLGSGIYLFTLTGDGFPICSRKIIIE